MILRILLLSFSIFSAIFSSNITCHKSRMQPLLKNDCYYYDHNDTFQHLNMGKAFSLLSKKIKLIAANAASSIYALFSSNKPTADRFGIDPAGIYKKIDSHPTNAHITWIGHASFLIQIDGCNILTDPIFGNVKAGSISVAARIMPPGIALKDLPPIDIIVISHNHIDHMDMDSLQQLAYQHNATVLVPRGNKEFLTHMQFTSIFEFSWWQDYTVTTTQNKKITISFLPAKHWSFRFSTKSNYRKALWGSWMISGTDCTIYFAGDTAYGSHFKEISQEFPSIDIALLPIAPTTKGANQHKHDHVNAQEAVQAFIDLNAHTFIPMHYGTFFGQEEHLYLPMQQLNNTWNQCAALLADKQLAIVQCGDPLDVSKYV